MYDGITDSDSVSDIKKKVFASSIQAIQDTMLLLDDQEVEKAVNAILQADRIDIYGMGGSGVMAMDLQHKMLKIGIRTNVYTDSHMQALSASQLKRRDVAIGISYSGTSRDTCEALELAKEILRLLKFRSEQELAEWYAWNKFGLYSPGHKGRTPSGL